MKTKLMILAALLIVILVGAFIYKEQKKPEEKPSFEATTNQPATETATSTNETIPLPTGTPGKLKVINFTGTLEQVNTGCFSDGECYVVVDGKHITTLMGWSQAEVGSVTGVPSFGDLESHVGKKVEVYAKDNGDGTYTLYGSAGFYVKAI